MRLRHSGERATHYRPDPRLQSDQFGNQDGPLGSKPCDPSEAGFAHRDCDFDEEAADDVLVALENVIFGEELD